MKMMSIEITFPCAVECPPGWGQTLEALVGMVCRHYEETHPTRSMWPAGVGAKPRLEMGEIRSFSDSIFVIEVAEREASEKELARRAHR